MLSLSKYERTRQGVNDLPNPFTLSALSLSKEMCQSASTVPLSVCRSMNGRARRPRHK
ncbi:MAG: hypothetical protein LBD67_06970 [Candidatus Accumulibacter sp.]|nr:hypothetical protein [Accumulibacter sp.]